VNIEAHLDQLSPGIMLAHQFGNRRATPQHKVIQGDCIDPGQELFGVIRPHVSSWISGLSACENQLQTNKVEQAETS
jgi:hypothetical protein